jgi:hypothetical protein
MQVTKSKITVTESFKQAIFSNALLVSALLFLATTLSSCEVIKGIFKAGMIVGVILVVIVVVIIMALIRMFKR